jgi:hypothetical protein
MGVATGEKFGTRGEACTTRFCGAWGLGPRLFWLFRRR